jgi:hypothetical protein
MTFRDPDLGRDRTTAALGRRDWGWFAGSGTMVPAEREAGQAPWGSTRHVSTHDRFDRTLGIPERGVSMWPLETLPLGGSDPAERAQAVCDELLAEPVTRRGWPDSQRSVELLAEVADTIYGRDTETQMARLVAAAHRHDIDATVAVELAGGVGSVIAQTAHQPAAPVPGAARLNILAGSRLPEAVQLFLARDHVRQAQALSDPDLPRLWMLANGLAHGTPVAVMRRVPGRSVGPAARVIPLHDDLLDWRGMRTAVEHMTATVTASAEGRRWLERTARLTGTDTAALAIGVVSLTNPKGAAALARHGLGHVTIERARAAAGAAPSGVLDLSDRALKAVCDRNGWLLGSPSERTQRELVQRAVPPDAGDTLRPRLAAGDGDALEQAVTADASDDATLDRRAFRKNPPAADVAAAQGLLRAASGEALSRFAGFDARPRASFAEAFAHRFPAQLSRGPLAEADPQHLIEPGAAPAVPQKADPLRLDLGL